MGFIIGNRDVFWPDLKVPFEILASMYSFCFFVPAISRGVQEVAHIR